MAPLSEWRWVVVVSTPDRHDVPTDLDACGGHVVNGSDYHYYAGEQGSNAILSCMTAEVGCVSERRGEVCDASGLFGKFGNTLSSPQ